MSSWIIAKSRPTNKKPIVTKYHATSSSTDVFSTYMEFLASYIYSQKMGETCSVWDTSDLLKTTLKTNPQVKYLKQEPEVSPLNISEYKGFTETMTFKDFQKIASNLLVYDSNLNQTVIRYLEKAGIKSIFDIGIHLIKDPSGPNLSLLKQYVALIKAYQTKLKKETLNIYIMTDNFAAVAHFQTYCDPSWKITSLSKNPPKDSDAFVQAMAEIQVMTALPAMILDFERPTDRFIYLMQRNQRGLQYFAEVNSSPWKLLA
jgi:hypothetical protein